MIGPGKKEKEKSLFVADFKVDVYHLPPPPPPRAPHANQLPPKNLNIVWPFATLSTAP